MQPFLLEKQAEIRELCRIHHVKQLFVFGSAARDDFDPDRSDVDVLVEFEEAPLQDYPQNKREFDEALVRLLHLDVDLIVRQYIRNPYFLRQVSQDKQMLYAA